MVYCCLCLQVISYQNQSYSPQERTSQIASNQKLKMYVITDKLSYYFLHVSLHIFLCGLLICQMRDRRRLADVAAIASCAWSWFAACNSVKTQHAMWQTTIFGIIAVLMTSGETERPGSGSCFVVCVLPSAAFVADFSWFLLCCLQFWSLSVFVGRDIRCGKGEVISIRSVHDLRLSHVLLHALNI